MTIELIRGTKRYRTKPDNPCMVEVQYRHGQRWVTYAIRDNEKEARELVLSLAKAGTSIEAKKRL